MPGSTVVTSAGPLNRQGDAVPAIGQVYAFASLYTLGGRKLRTNIVIDDRLMAEAMRLSGARTKRQAVEESLRLMVRLKKQERVRVARGQLRWSGDLEAMRAD